LGGDNLGKLVDGGFYFFIGEVAIHHPERFITTHSSSLWSLALEHAGPEQGRVKNNYLSEIKRLVNGVILRKRP
jgi:hypothetical protein